MTAKKTLVTGGSGHVGANLVRELLARGVAVKVLCQRDANNTALDGLDVERVYGDLRDKESLKPAVQGCDRMYHVAAFVSLRAGDTDELFATNVVGTKSLFDVAERAGVERTVYCSSFGAIGVNPHGPSDETFTVNPYDVHLDYELSKAVSELEAHRAVARGMDIVIVNPSGVVGPHDYLPSSVGRTILDFAAGKMRAYLPGGFEFVAVRDVVAGHLLAMEKGKTGERYILSGGHHTLEDILQHLHKQIGAPMPRLKLPLPLMKPVAAASTFVMKRFFPDVPPRFTPGTIRLLSSSKSATTQKAQTDLGFKPTSVFAAYDEQIAWFEARGALKRRAGAPVLSVAA
ncbi:MAG: SDR family oxidoreductase [Deltaproteobacteria bacterium]|nr:SDR family oxidoreductase [Deltaproteobacteria bacterium]